jgi:hypothetical protein
MRQTSYSRRASWAVIVALVCVPPALGDLFSFELPELLGRYHNASRDVTLDLGVSFSSIQSVSLRLTGTHQVGSYSDLNFPGSFPYPAELIGTLPELVYPVITGFDEILPDHSGTFDVTLPFRRWLQPQLGVDFSPLVDGEAEFDFSVHGPALIATTFVTSSPSVTIESAALIVDGQPELGTVGLPGDYDGNGRVDLDDYDAWRGAFGSGDPRADGNGDGVVDAADYSVWRDNLGAGGAGSLGQHESAPEPGSCLLAVLTWTAILLLRRATRAVTASA